MEALESRLLLTAGVPLGGTTAFVTYTDADGTVVTVKLTKGTAELYFAGISGPPTPSGKGLLVPGSNVQLDTVDLLTASAGSKLTFTTKYGTVPGAIIGSITNSSGDVSLGALAAATMDLTGDGIDLSGAGVIGSITLHSVQNQADISIPGTAPAGVTITVGQIADGTDIDLSGGLKSLSLGSWSGTGSLEAAWIGKISATGEVQDVSVTTSGAITTLSAAQWDGGTISADSLHTLRIKGRRASRNVTALAGDLGADLTLAGSQVSSGQKVLASARVAGVVGGTVHIGGDVGNFTGGTLSRQLTIDGKAVVKFNSPLSVAPPSGGSIGQLHVGGLANVTGGKQKFKFTDGDLYTVVTNTYSVADLLGLSSPGSSTDYNLTDTTNGQTDSGTATMALASTPDSINGNDAYGWSVGKAGDGLMTERWWFDANSKVQMAQWLLNTNEMGNPQLTFATPLGVPQNMAVGQKCSSTSQITGQWAVDVSGDDESSPDWQTMTITGGNATMSLTVAGVEQITVGGTTYMAVKLTSSLTMSGIVGQLNYQGVHNSSGNITDNETFWAVPNVGIVKVVTTIHMRGATTGLGSGSFTTVSTLTLP